MFGTQEVTTLEKLAKELIHDEDNTLILITVKQDWMVSLKHSSESHT